jgi:hypothetical protein
VCILASFSSPFLYNRPKIQKKGLPFEVAPYIQIKTQLLEIPPVASNTGFVPVQAIIFNING